MEVQEAKNINLLYLKFVRSHKIILSLVIGGGGRTFDQGQALIFWYVMFIPKHLIGRDVGRETGKG